MSREQNDNPLSLADLSQPLNYEETNDIEFEIDWDAIHSLDPWTKKRVIAGKMKTPMRKKYGTE
tara:strand:+ start:2510 stop:2701 length:192 start_codon:yes stop_codon:yes gene_type:complete